MTKILFMSFLLFFSCTKTIKKELIPVFQDDEYQITGVAVSQTGRIFVNYPYWSDKHSYSLIEVLPDGQKIPYPNVEMNQWSFEKDGKNAWVCVQAVFVDEKDILWVVDPAAPYLAEVFSFGNPALKNYKLVAFDLKNNQIVAQYDFEQKIGSDSYVNDVRIDNNNQFAYLSNSKTGGIIVLNLKTGETKEVLKNHFSTQANPNYEFKPNKGKIWMNNNLEPVKVNSDGLTLSVDKSILYYKSLTDDDLYQISTEFLRDFSKSEQELEDQVIALGHISTSDGMITDENGKIYLGDLENNQIIVFNPKTKEKSILIQDERLQWADSFSIYEGFLYITCSQIHQSPNFNGGIDKRTSAYEIFKVKI